jgi:hypothetical protein
MEWTARKAEGGAYMKQAARPVSAWRACLKGIGQMLCRLCGGVVPPLMYALDSCSPIFIAKRSHGVMNCHVVLAVKQERNIELPQVFLVRGRVDVSVRSPWRSYEKGNRNRQESSSSIHPLLQDETVG